MEQRTTDTAEIPYGYCHCGCGQRTNLASRNYWDRGVMKGEPVKYLLHHNPGPPPKPRPVPILIPQFGVAAIPLVGRRGDGKVAIVDLCDVAPVVQYRWSLLEAGGVSYAVTHHPTERNHTILLHQLILGSDGVTDHVNGNGLDNRRVNLRKATIAQNASNRRLPRTNRSGLKGVSKHHDRSGKWVAHIKANGVQRNLGTFDTPEEAAMVYDRAARELHGEFACVNYPKPGERSAR